MKRYLIDNIKNAIGWKTNRKLLAFAVDDYGNVRMNSKQARDALEKSGVPLQGRFDYLDALDTKDDLEMLYEVLTSVKDKNGNAAIFTTYALPCNVDFEKVLEFRDGYHYETLDRTYQRLTADQPSAYEGTWGMLREGISSNLLCPQFHGREHLNIEVFEGHLRDGHAALIKNLLHKSMAGIPRHSDFPFIDYTEAFAFNNVEVLDKHQAILKDGIERFEQVYGFFSSSITPPAQQLHPDLFPYLTSLGVKSLDKPLQKKRHLGEGEYKFEVNWSGKRRKHEAVTVVRNVVFEPNEPGSLDWVEFAFRQVKTAFFWHKPAIISSHRVNFCGHIDPLNRDSGLKALRLLLKRVVLEFPEVEFVSIDNLVRQMNDESN